MFSQYASLISRLQTIGTHDGTFHCDEALAVFLLRLTEKYHAAGTHTRNVFATSFSTVL